jgi:hypothetical protein
VAHRGHELHFDNFQKGPLTMTNHLALRPDPQGLTEPTVLMVGGKDLVLLGTVENGFLQLWDGDRAVVCAADSLPIVASHERRQVALRRTLAELNAERLTTVQAIQQSTARHESTLADVRRYVIEAYHNQDVQRDAVNRFLLAFDLPEYTENVEVSYAVRGKHQVITKDVAAARTAALTGLTVNLSEVDDVVDLSDSHRVIVEGAGVLNGPNGLAGCEIRWLVIGSYEVTVGSLEAIETDGRDYLRIDCDLPDLVAGSLTSSVEYVDACLGE